MHTGQHQMLSPHKIAIDIDVVSYPNTSTTNCKSSFLEAMQGYVQGLGATPLLSATVSLSSTLTCTDLSEKPYSGP